jgi:hypothetical protein
MKTPDWSSNLLERATLSLTISMRMDTREQILTACWVCMMSWKVAGDIVVRLVSADSLSGWGAVGTIDRRAVLGASSSSQKEYSEGTT